MYYAGLHTAMRSPATNPRTFARAHHMTHAGTIRQFDRCDNHYVSYRAIDVTSVRFVFKRTVCYEKITRFPS